MSECEMGKSFIEDKLDEWHKAKATGTITVAIEVTDGKTTGISCKADEGVLPALQPGLMMPRRVKASS